MAAEENWFTKVTIVVASVALSGLVSWYISSSQSELTTKIYETSLSRDLAKEFYIEKNIYGPIRRAIDRCDPLWVNNRGRFTGDQLNIYLGFLDDLGFYHKQNLLSLKTIDQVFGAIIIEAFEYPELQRYIIDLRRASGRDDVQKEFEDLAKLLESQPQRQQEVQSAREVCGQIKKRKQG